MDSKRIVVIGSCNTDMVVKSERFPASGETILGGIFSMHAGGKGANQSVAAARLGGDVTFICKTGKDIFGQQLLDIYTNESIDTGYVLRDESLPSGVALITVDSEGENCIVVASGANSALVPGDIDSARHVFDNAGLLLMQLEIPLETVCHAARQAHEKGVRVVLNPAPARKLPDDLMPLVHILVPNRNEAEMLSGVKVTGWESARRAADVLQGKGVQVVVITLGSMGALIKEGGVFTEVHVPAADAVDTTAAGDTFCGALCVGLTEGMTTREAVDFANKAAGIAVTRMGAQSSIPYRRELEI